MGHVFNSLNQRDTKQQRKIKGPETGAMRHHVVCVHKHLNHGTEEKQTRTTRSSWKQWIERISQNLITVLDLCNNASRGKRLSQRRGTTASQRRDTKHGLAEAKHQATRQWKSWLKTSRNIDSKYHETVKTFPRIRELMESSQPENKTLLRVSRLHSGTLRQQSNQMYMAGRVSKTARVTLKITKHEIPRKSSRTRAKTNKQK